MRRGRSVRGGWWLAAGIASGTALGVAASRLRSKEEATAPAPDRELVAAAPVLEPVASPAPAADRRSRRRGVVPATGLLALAALGAGIAVVVAHDPANTAPATIARPAPTTHGVLNARTTRTRPLRTASTRTTQPKAPRATRPAGTTGFVPARVFAWPAASGADAYLIRFYRDDRVVLERRITDAHFTLPSSFRLVPGKYRWLVLPQAGGRYGRAVVDSRFSIGRG